MSEWLFHLRVTAAAVVALMVAAHARPFTGQISIGSEGAAAADAEN